jgi:hypothetical protein
VRVTEPRIESDAQGVELSAALGGTRVRWMLPPGSALEPRGEAFAIAALMPAMRLGTPLILPAGWPVDPVLLDNLVALQAIWQRWFPGLRAVPIEAERAPRAMPVARRMTGFSGGVDSSYTVAALAPQLDTLVFIDGIDAKRRDAGIVTDVVAGHRTLARTLGLDLWVVRTDVKAFSNQQRLSWLIYHGAGLAATAHALSAASYAIAGSNSWENLHPMGTHPLTDPLFSSATTTVTHHGADQRRIDKVRALGNTPALLDRLRVCLEGTDYNCGRCGKCLQTAAELRVARLAAAALPALEQPRMLRQTSVTSDGDLVDWAELLDDTLEQRDPALARELRRLIGRYRRRRLVREAEALVLGGRGKRLLRRLGLAAPEHRAVG